MSEAADIARTLSLEPHPEGGFFRETYRAREHVMTPRGSRAASSVILFLVTAASPSRLHRVASDSLWLHHTGAALDLVMLGPGGGAGRMLLGGLGVPAERQSDGALPGAAPARMAAGAQVAAPARSAAPQALVPARAWQAARVTPGSDLDWTLVSCVVTPGFDYDDFELADPAELVSQYPDQADLIAALT